MIEADATTPPAGRRAGSLLFIAGGTDVMESSFAVEDCAYWSAIFDLILERHGWCDMHVAPPDMLNDPESLRRFDAIVVAWLPPAFWKESYKLGLRAFDGPVFLEGPLPLGLLGFAGLRKIDLPSPRTGVGQMEAVGALAIQAYGAESKRVFSLDRVVNDHEETDQARTDRVVSRYASAYRRLVDERGMLYGSQPLTNALAVLAWVRFALKLEERDAREKALAISNELITAAAPPGAPANLAERLVIPIWCSAVALAAQSHVVEPGAVERAQSALDARMQESGPVELEVNEWWRYALALWERSSKGQSGPPIDVTRLPIRPEEAIAEARDGVAFWVRAAACAASPAAISDVDLAWLEGLAASLEREDGTTILPTRLAGWEVYQIVPLSAALRLRGHPRAGARLLQACYDAALDPDSGLLRHGAVTDSGQIDAQGGLIQAPHVLLGAVEHVERIGAPVSFWTERYEAAGATAEVQVFVDGGESVGIARRGRVMSTSFQILAQLAQRRAVAGEATVPASELERWQEDEASFVALLERFFAAYGRYVPKLERDAPAATDSPFEPCFHLSARLALSSTGRLSRVTRDCNRSDVAVEPGAVVHVRRTSDSPSSVTYSISRASHLRIGPLRLRVGAQKVTAAEVTLNGETKRANWETAPDSAVLTLDLDGIAEDNVEITLSRERAPRYHEVLSHLPQSPREPGLEPDYLLPRVERIIEVLNRYTTIHNVTDATLVDVGCGPGPFPIATALVENPQGMIGVDLKPSIDRATELLESLTVTNVDFAAADMADTAEVVDNADGILVNNSIVFMNSRRKCKRAIRSFASALRPGGGIVLLTANRRYYREPFTGLIGAHWLPRFLASLYVRLRRERETYMDVRIHSTRELMRWLRRAGFTDITAVDADTLTADGRRRFWGERCYVTARRAG